MARQSLSLRARAVALLAQREHSELELRRKLGRIARDAALKSTQEAAGGLGTVVPGRLGATGSARRRAIDLDAADLNTADLNATDPGGAAYLDGADLDADVDHASIDQEVEDVLAWVRSQGYLDESRFVESRLHARTSRWGQRRIEQELAQHGLSLDAEQRATLAHSELGRACELLRRKFGERPEPDPATEARQMRFLMGRGFGSELCRRAIRAVRAGEPLED